MTRRRRDTEIRNLNVIDMILIDHQFLKECIEILIDEKIKLLKPRVSCSRLLKDEIEAELKVLAELVKRHIKEEESELLPKMTSELEDEMLKDMGEVFMNLRKISPKELRTYPQLEDQLVVWKDDVQKVSSQFLSKMDRYVENLKH